MDDKSSANQHWLARWAWQIYDAAAEFQFCIPFFPDAPLTACARNDCSIEIFLDEILNSVILSSRALLQTMRVYELNEQDAENYPLLNIDVDALCIQHQMWLRKLSEACVDLILLSGPESPTEIFTAYCQFHEYSARKVHYFQLKEDYGARSQQMESYLHTGDAEFKKSCLALEKVGIVRGERPVKFQQRLRDAWGQLDDIERMVIGSYVAYRHKSTEVHFSIFPSKDPVGDSTALFDLLLFQAALSTRLVIRSVTLATTDLDFIEDIYVEEVETMLSDAAATRYRLGLKPGDKITLGHKSSFVDAVLVEAKSGKIGESFRLSLQEKGATPWHPFDFHPATLIRR